MYCFVNGLYAQMQSSVAFTCLVQWLLLFVKLKMISSVFVLDEYAPGQVVLLDTCFRIEFGRCLHSCQRFLLRCCSPFSTILMADRKLHGGNNWFVNMLVKNSLEVVCRFFFWEMNVYCLIIRLDYDRCSMIWFQIIVAFYEAVTCEFF